MRGKRGQELGGVGKGREDGDIYNTVNNKNEVKKT